jgi:ribonuclease R
MGKDTAVFVTIDSSSTKDVDDAIKISQTDDGFEVVVAIADPTDLVLPNSPIDLKAREKAATVYVRDHARDSMLPSVISEKKCSLTAGKPRSAFVFTMRLDSELQVLDFTPSLQTITVAHRLHYEDIPGIAADAEHPLHEQIACAVRMAQALMATRRKRGALALYDLKQFLMTDEEGNLQQLTSREDTVGNVLVQEMMILCNRLFGDYLVKHNIQAVYRNHEATLAAPPVGELMASIESLLFANNADKAVASDRLHTLLGRAKYEPVAAGHYGLSLPVYTHGTSPLRRYPDLINLRQLKAHLSGTDFVYTQDELWAITSQINDTLRERHEARRESFKETAARKAEVMEQAGKLRQMDDSMLGMAVRNVRLSNLFGDALAGEICRRLKTGAIADGVIDRLFMETDRALIPDNLAQAMSEWLFKYTTKAMHLVLFGTSLNLFSEYSVECTTVNGRFRAKASLVMANNQRITSQGKGARKKEAEQIATAILIAKACNLPHGGHTEVATEVDTDPTPATQAAQTLTSVPVNSKGALLEFCTKHRLKTPTFAVSTMGPAHKPTFVCSASTAFDGKAMKVSSGPCDTRKAAEAKASHLLLEQLTMAVSMAKKSIPTVATTNPVGAVQEFMQKLALPMPDYNFVSHSETPPIFECLMAFKVNGRAFAHSARASTKKDAKTMAASQAWAALHA